MLLNHNLLTLMHFYMSFSESVNQVGGLIEWGEEEWSVFFSF
jgi:hypothetical protein